MLRIGAYAELGVARKLAEWPRLVEILRVQMNRIGLHFTAELASDLHSLWNRGL